MVQTELSKFHNVCKYHVYFCNVLIFLIRILRLIEHTALVRISYLHRNDAPLQ